MQNCLENCNPLLTNLNSTCLWWKIICQRCFYGRWTSRSRGFACRGQSRRIHLRRIAISRAERYHTRCFTAFRVCMQIGLARLAKYEAAITCGHARVNSRPIVHREWFRCMQSHYRGPPLAVNDTCSTRTLSQRNAITAYTALRAGELYRAEALSVNARSRGRVFLIE